MKRAGLKDIAQKLGVSVVTVSNALSGRGGVSRQKRERIIKEAKLLDIDISRYQRAADSSSTIGVIVSNRYIYVGTSFYWELYQKTAYAASRRGCFTSLEIIENDGKLSDLPKILTEGDIDALIVIGKVREEYLGRILSFAAVPVVLVDFLSRHLKCSAVMSSNYIGMYRSTSYLAKLGHTDIGFVGTVSTSDNVLERFKDVCSPLALR